MAEKFLGHGEVEATAYDPGSQELELRVRAPASVVHAVMPILCRTAVVDDVRLAMPVSTWAPPIDRSHVLPEVLSRHPNADRDVNTAIRTKTEETLRTAVEVMAVLRDPGAALYMLPMGTYVDVTVRTTAEGLAATIHEVGGSGVPGADDTARAMAAVLARLLGGSGDVRPGGT